MAKSQARDLVQALGQPRQRAGALQGAHGLELAPGGAARADEVCVVGVRQPVRVGPRRGDHGALLEREHRVGGAGGSEQRLDRLHPLRVRDRMPRAVEHADPDSVGRRDERRNSAPFE